MMVMRSSTETAKSRHSYSLSTLKESDVTILNTMCCSLLIRNVVGISVMELIVFLVS
jgi:hypothetical protein